MAIDLLCGQCEGHLLAEEPGSVVACPHCGAHLQVPGAVAGEAVVETGLAENASPVESLVVEQAVAVVETTVAAAAEAVSAELPALDAPEPAEQLSSAPVAADETVPAPISELPSQSTTRISAASMFEVMDQSPRPSMPVAAPAHLPNIEDSGPTEAATVPRFWFILVVSYASAVTLAFLFLLLTLGRMKTHPLESLPDVVPKIQNGEVGLEVAPPEAAVARGHVLPLGETRRFGSLKVSPLRITQGTLKFEHVLNDPSAVRPPSEPVLKLWLKFENVSRNQTFAPLDSLLLFKRHYQDFSKAALTNQFLCRTEERTNRGDLHYLFEISMHSEFRIAGQNLDAVLAPGDTVEMFIPSEERIDDLTGDLVWRVQFRKGYHPRTRHGVTTLIDVPFQRSDVQQEI